MMLVALAGACVAGTAAFAQDAKPLGPKPIEVKLDASKVMPIGVPIRSEPAWSDDEAKSVGALLAGGWKTTAPVKSPGADQAFDVAVGIAPIYVMGMKNTLYVEMARADALNRPYRGLIWHLVKIKGAWHMQSMEFRRPKGTLGSAAGLWMAPDVFPILNADDLVSTMDIPLTSESGVLKGKTSVGYATTVGGAVEMTSEISIADGKITVADRGFDADGKQVWGPASGETYAFSKVDLGIKVNKWDSGLVAITYPSQLTGTAAKDGELVTVNYAGYLENGTVFDSSYERNQPFQYPKGSKLIEGWTTSMADAQLGLKRRIVVPAALAYGERGSRGKVPPMATLIFDLEVLKVEPAPQAAVPVVNSDPAAGGKPEIKQVEPPPEIKAKMEADMRRRMEEKLKKEAEKQTPKEAPKH